MDFVDAAVDGREPDNDAALIAELDRSINEARPVREFFNADDVPLIFRSEARAFAEQLNAIELHITTGGGCIREQYTENVSLGIFKFGNRCMGSLWQDFVEVYTDYTDNETMRKHSDLVASRTRNIDALDKKVIAIPEWMQSSWVSLDEIKIGGKRPADFAASAESERDDYARKADAASNIIKEIQRRANELPEYLARLSRDMGACMMLLDATASATATSSDTDTATAADVQPITFNVCDMFELVADGTIDEVLTVKVLPTFTAPEDILRSMQTPFFTPKGVSSDHTPCSDLRRALCIQQTNLFKNAEKVRETLWTEYRCTADSIDEVQLAFQAAEADLDFQDTLKMELLRDRSPWVMQWIADKGIELQFETVTPNIAHFATTGAVLQRIKPRLDVCMQRIEEAKLFFDTYYTMKMETDA